MKTQKTWFITGAPRGSGLEITKAVLATGDKVVATQYPSDYSQPLYNFTHKVVIK